MAQDGGRSRSWTGLEIALDQPEILAILRSATNPINKNLTVQPVFSVWFHTFPL